MSGEERFAALKPLRDAEKLVQEAGFEPDYERSGSPLYWKRQGTSATLKEAVAIEDAAYRAGTAAAEAAWTVIHDEIHDAAIEVARITTDGDAEKAAQDAAHATAAAAAWAVFDAVQRSAWELVDRIHRHRATDEPAGTRSDEE